MTIMSWATDYSHFVTFKQQVAMLQSQLKKEKTDDKQDAKTASSLSGIQSAARVRT